MNITKARIYGFGKWIDQTFIFSPYDKPFICFYGENESGKSTLQQFILFILFGLPPRKRNFYRPRQSNKVGGQLTIYDSATGTFTIERVEDNVTCLLPGGEQRDEKWLQDHFKHVTRKVYTDIYTFSAVDLEEIRQMGEDQLSDVLFSVGLTGATNIYNVEKKLESTLGNLFKKAGRVPMMNRQLIKIKESYENVHKYKSIESSYMSLKEEKNSIIRKLNENRKAIYEQREKEFMYEQIEHFLPVMEEYHMKREQLASLPKHLPFPEEGISRYENVKNELLPLKSELASLDSSVKNYEKNYESILSTLYKNEVYEHANKLLADKQTFDNQVLELKQINNTIKKIDEWVMEQTLQMGINVDEINSYSFPFQLENEWQEIYQANKMLTETKRKIDEDEASLKIEQQQWDKQYDELQQKLFPDEKLKRIESKVKEYELHNYEHLSRKKEHEHLQKWIKHRDTVAKKIFIFLTFLASSLFLSGFIADILFFTLSGLATFIVSSILFYLLKGSTRTLKTVIDESKEKPTISEQEYNEYCNELENQHQLHIALQTMEHEKNRMTNQRLFIEQKRDALLKNNEEWSKRKNVMQENYPFLKHVDIDYWLDLLANIRKVKEKLKEKDAFVQSRNDLLNNMHEYELKLQSFAKKVNWQYENFTIENVENIVADYRKNNQLLQEYKQLIEESKEKQKLMQKKVDVFTSEINRLLEIAGVDNEEDYYKRASQLEEKRKLKEALNKIEQQINNTFPSTIRKRMFNNEINLQTVQLELKIIKEKISELDSSDLMENKRLAEVEHKIKEMEQSEDFSKSEFIFQMQRDEMNELAQKWAIHKVALSALQDAKKSYQEKYFSEIMTVTTTYFKQLTGGTYEQVYAPVDNTPFQVETSSNVRYAVGELSQGTIDQLYVSLRLAIGYVMGKKYKIPFIIDDAFVHFDDKRTKQMIDILREISESHQVVLFTCKENVATLASGQPITEEHSIII